MIEGNRTVFDNRWSGLDRRRPILRASVGMSRRGVGGGVRESARTGYLWDGYSVITAVAESLNESGV
jgi:hypothetical protein